jgi:hypothetical protein
VNSGFDHDDLTSDLKLNKSVTLIHNLITSSPDATNPMLVSHIEQFTQQNFQAFSKVQLSIINEAMGHVERLK